MAKKKPRYVTNTAMHTRKAAEVKARLICPNCGSLELDYTEFLHQVRFNKLEDIWVCPSCGGAAKFDERFYDRANLKE